MATQLLEESVDLRIMTVEDLRIMTVEDFRIVQVKMK
jgi:hypothetical protein